MAKFYDKTMEFPGDIYYNLNDKFSENFDKNWLHCWSMMHHDFFLYNIYEILDLD